MPRPKPSSDLIRRLEKHLDQKKWFREGEKILIACSGGPDSVALTYLINKIAGSRRWNLSLIHFHHGLRGRHADRDAKFVRRTARRLGMEFYSGRGNVAALARREKLSIEEAARKARYDFLIQTARRLKIRKVLLAHTLDDQAETVMMRVLQGTGLRGLIGIREKLNLNGILFLRPLLSFSKEELLGFLKAEKISYQKDESNFSMNFLRNKIRRKLMPLLERDVNPRVMSALARIPEILQDENDILENLFVRAWKDSVPRQRTAKGIKLRAKAFFNLAPALQFRVLDGALRRVHPASGLSFEAWKSIRPALSGKRGRWTLPQRLDLVVTPSAVNICKM